MQIFKNRIILFLLILAIVLIAALYLLLPTMRYWISALWTPISVISTLILASVTALMAIYTKEMAEQTKGMRIDEQIRREEEQAQKEESIIRETLLILIKDIQAYERSYYNLGYISHVTNITSIEENRLRTIISTLDAYPPVYDEVLNYLKAINVPSSLLTILLWSISTIQIKYADLKKDIYAIINTQASEVNRAISITISRYSELRLYQIQLGRYIMYDAKRLGYSKLTETIEYTGLLEPTSDMASFMNRLVDRNEALEPEEDEYRECRMNYIVSMAATLAIDQQEEERRRLMESLQQLDDSEITTSISDIFMERSGNKGEDT